MARAASWDVISTTVLLAFAGVLGAEATLTPGDGRHAKFVQPVRSAASSAFDYCTVICFVQTPVVIYCRRFLATAACFS